MTERSLMSLDHRDKPARALVAERHYAASPEEVWAVLTDPERLPRWFLPVEGDLTVGGRYQLVGNAGGVVERCDPPRSFAVTWEYGEQVSWVEVDLREALEAHRESTTVDRVRIDDEELHVPAVFLRAAHGAVARPASSRHTTPEPS